MKTEKNTEIKFKHSTPIQIRFNDVDSVGHVNNTVLLSYMDYAKLQYLNFINKGLQKKASIVIVHYDVDFFKPVFLEDEIHVETSIVHIGNRSIQFLQRICTGEDINCVCETVMSGFDPENNTSADIPLEFKKTIASFEGNPNLLQ